MSEIKIKKVFNLRRKIDATPSQIEDPLSNSLQQSQITKKVTEPDEQPSPYHPIAAGAQSTDRNTNLINNNPALLDSSTNLPTLYSIPELTMDTSYLRFQKQVNRIQIKEIKVTNIGTSAMYYEWVRLPRTKINAHAILDQNSKFFCHHDKNVIMPGESTTFMFSFLSKISGVFIEEFEFKCQPEPVTKLPILKLQGKAFIKDELAEQRSLFASQMKKAYIEKAMKQIISDIIDQVKSPEQPRPDTSIPAVAMMQFEKANSSYGLFYNELAYSWWKQLFDEVWTELGLNPMDKYWDLAVDGLKKLIEKVKDEVKKQFFSDRFINYFHLSRKPLLEKSPLYNDIRNMLGKVALHIAGQYNDTARKELDMWESNWKDIRDEDAEVTKKAKDEELAKIKAEWLKKAKKKKWTEQDEKALINEYKSKIEVKAKEDILKHFTNYELTSNYIRTEQLIHKKPLSPQYFNSLARLKTAKEVEIEGRVVFLKTELKLKSGISLEKLHEFKEYLIKKKQYEKKLQQERNDLEKQKNDKKKTTVKKAAKKKEETVEEKPPTFNIMEILDEASYKSVIDVVKYVADRSPKLLIVGCNYGPRLGIQDHTYSLEFLQSLLKENDLVLQFLPHSQLSTFPQKVENQHFADGTLLLLENLNFLPWETLGYESENKKHLLLMSEIQEGLACLNSTVSVFINDNNFENESGIAMYLKKENVLGTNWWKDIGTCLKAQNSDMIIGGPLTPSILEVIDAARWYAKRIFLVGQLGLKFYMNKQGVSEFAGVKLTEHEKRGLTSLDAKISQPWEKDVPNNKKTPEPHKADIIIPNDVLIRYSDSREQSVTISAEELHAGCHVIDMGAQTVETLIAYIRSSRQLFIVKQPWVDASSKVSFKVILRQFARIKEERVARHHDEGKKGSINYSLDTVITMVGKLDDAIQSIELKDKPVREKRINQEGQEEEQEEFKEEDNEEKVRNITLVQDFYSENIEYAESVLSGKFNYSISNLYQYPQSID